jgi:hypothetical protein
VHRQAQAAGHARAAALTWSWCPGSPSLAPSACRWRTSPAPAQGGGGACRRQAVGAAWAAHTLRAGSGGAQPVQSRALEGQPLTSRYAQYVWLLMSAALSAQRGITPKVLQAGRELGLGEACTPAAHKQAAGSTRMVGSGWPNPTELTWRREAAGPPSPPGSGTRPGCWWPPLQQRGRGGQLLLNGWLC